MIVAFDTYYYNGYSYTVGGVFKSWNDKEVAYYATSKRMRIDADYKPGELYKRELPCIMQCLALIPIKDITLIMVDGFVWLSEDGKTLTKGLGAHLQEAILEKYGEKITVVGVAKNRYHVEIPDCYDIERGLESAKPLFVTCSEPCLARHYSNMVKIMHGDYRIPSILKAVDTKTRELGHEDSDEIEKELEEEYNSKPIDISMGDIDEFMATCTKNGFKYR